MGLSEFELIREFFTLRARCINRNDLVEGIGDDCALVLPRVGQELAITMDTLIAGVHFPEQISPYDIGYRSLAVNLSDLAAMGAEPAWFTLALTLPESDKEWLREFSRGLFELAEIHQVLLIGGDTTRGPLSITIQAQGYVPSGGALLRSGASEGDLIYVSGHPGDAAGGLCQIQSGRKDSLCYRFLRPQPRIELGRRLRGVASAAIDISDGLWGDLGHIANRSGLSARLEESKLPLSKALIDACGREQALNKALSGGDDYELCFCVPKENIDLVADIAGQQELPLTEVGVMQEGSGVTMMDASGTAVSTFEGRGYQHF